MLNQSTGVIAETAPQPEVAERDLVSQQVEHADPSEVLSLRQFEIADRAARGQSFQSIAEELWISSTAVRSHMHATYKKLDIKSKKELPFSLGPYQESLQDLDFESMTDSERNVFDLMVNGYSTDQIGQELDVDNLVVKTHQKNIQNIFGLTKPAQLANAALALRYKKVDAAIDIQARVRHGLARISEQDDWPEFDKRGLSASIKIVLADHYETKSIMSDPRTREVAYEVVQQEVRLLLGKSDKSL